MDESQLQQETNQPPPQTGMERVRCTPDRHACHSVPVPKQCAAGPRQQRQRLPATPRCRAAGRSEGKVVGGWALKIFLVALPTLQAFPSTRCTTCLLRRQLGTRTHLAQSRGWHPRPSVLCRRCHSPPPPRLWKRRTGMLRMIARFSCQREVLLHPKLGTQSFLTKLNDDTWNQLTAAGGHTGNHVLVISQRLQQAAVVCAMCPAG